MELKPCPFCGGKTLYVIKDHSDFSPLMFCNWCKAMVTWEPIEDEEATQEVVADLKRRWNTRAERTCHRMTADDGAVVVRRGGFEMEFPYFECSECGAYVMDNARYCPNCGRRVVE